MVHEAETDYTDPYHSVEMNYGFLSLAAETGETGRSPPQATHTWQESMGFIPERYREETPERGISEVLSRMREGGEIGRDGA